MATDPCEKDLCGDSSMKTACALLSTVPVMEKKSLIRICEQIIFVTLRSFWPYLVKNMWTGHDPSMVAANGVFCEVVLGGQKALERSYSALSEKGLVNSKEIFSCFRNRMMDDIIFSHSVFGPTFLSGFMVGPGSVGRHWKIQPGMWIASWFFWHVFVELCFLEWWLPSLKPT